MTLLLLLAAGALGGFIAGLVGVGGGIIFGPVLFFTLQALGFEDPVLTPVVLGSSLLCTFAASLSGALAQRRAGAIDYATVAWAGGAAAVVVTLMGLFVTTRPWYSKEEFQVVLSAILVLVVGRMLLNRDADRADGNTLSTAGARRHPAFLAGTGAAAGALAAAAGVGGGVIMVPAFHGLVRLPLKVAAGTSTAAIVLLTGTGMLVYAVLGWGVPGLPPGSVGYVALPHALTLALPAAFSAHWGVAVAHRVDVRWVQYSFAAFAGLVATRLVWNALG